MLHHVTRFAVAVAILGGAASAAAQNSASASVTADVQTPITVTKNNDLVFGQVFPGVDKTIAVTASDAAAFAIQGQGSTNVHITFTLPATISSGSNTLPIANWTGRYNSTNSSVSGTDFTPSLSATTAALASGGALYLFIGATAQPDVAQAAGSYTGTVTVTVVYF